ncbi:hypothetical protein [Youngiibacter multivorans]|uniref:Uncharacterized protein n=1 Tax=Youngiibacter multivorans TaxID=937251 RepID=A0ABS4G0H6_9CLOT|nr:hypothetical protein [Youngiibacter multivorans]MBP1918037.1 hypothetical protein [Youngiibacter multivorans]
MDRWKRKAYAAVDLYAAFLLLYSGVRLTSAYGALPGNIGAYGISIFMVKSAGKGILIAAFLISVILFAALASYARIKRDPAYWIVASKLLSASILPLINERTVKAIYGASGVYTYLEGFLGWTAAAVLAAILASVIFRMYLKKAK